MKNMMKKILAILIVVSLVLAMASCGGGSGGSSGAKKSGLSTNGFFGAVPAVYADHDLAFDALKEKRDKAQEEALKSQNAKAYQNAEDEYDKAWDELDAKFEADKKAAWEKIKGKDVEFSTSAKFNAFTVSSLKVDEEEGYLIAGISNLKSADNIFGIVYFSYRALAKDGSVISDPHQLILSGNNKDKIVTYINREPEKWVDFAKIEFISEDE